jgi:hypothetical protein
MWTAKKPVKGKDGNPLKTTEEQLLTWPEHTSRPE